MKVMIVTDLDGSLLNHEDYSFGEAMPSLALIKARGAPLIMTTSKTRREVEALQLEMGIQEPFIVENGGGIFIPSGYRSLAVDKGWQRDDYTLIAMGTNYRRVRDFLESAKDHFMLRGFGDMDAAEIADVTGLPLDRAALAKEREFTEPFLTALPEDIGPLRVMAAVEGLIVTSGGRFHHLMGRDQDKGKAVRLLLELFRKKEAWLAIGLGDSENDLAMLAEVDVPVLIPRPEKGYLDIELPGLIRAKEAGAKGWNEVVQRLLNEQGEAFMNGS